MPLCLFCPSELDETTEPEHILLNALGGRITTKDAICSTCNHRFGETIDDALASSVMSIRNFFHLKSGSGNQAPTLRGVQAGAQKINVKGDGRLELVDKPFTVEDLGDGRWNLQISLDAANFEEDLRRLIPHMAAKLKITEDQLRQLLSGARPSLISHRPDTAEHMLALGGPDVLGSIVKASLVLWSTLVGNDEVKGEHYAAARRFVAEGDESFNLDHVRLDSRIFDNVEKMKAEFGPLFNFIYVRSNDVGRVIGHFTLYNMVAWQFTLAESGGTPNLKIALISNPEEPSRRSNCAADEFDIPFAWLATPDYSLEQAKARMDDMIKSYYDSNRETPVHLIMEECCKTLGIAPDEPLSAEKAEELKMLATYRLGHYGFGLPYVETITAEQFAEILQK